MLVALWGVSVVDLERGWNDRQMCALGHSKASAAEFSFDSFGKSRTHGVIKNLLNESSNSVHCFLSFNLFSHVSPLKYKVYSAKDHETPH